MNEGMQIDVIAQTKAQVQALAIIENYEIQSADEATTAADQLQRVKGLMKTLEEARVAETQPLRLQVNAINARYAEGKELLERAEGTLKGALLFFQKAENARQEEQRRLANEAAAAERAKLEEAARKERERAEKEAEKLRAAGKEEKADAVVQIAESQARAKETVASLVAAPTKPAGPVKFAGTTVRKTWRGKVVDMPQFLRSLAGSHYPIEEFVTVNQGALDRLAKSLQKNMDKAMPGTIAWEEETMGARAK